jgi:hypothetical protein
MPSDLSMIKDHVNQICQLESNQKNIKEFIASMIMRLINNFKNKYNEVTETFRILLRKTWEKISDIHFSIETKIIELEKCCKELKEKSIEQLKSALTIISDLDELFQKLPKRIVSIMPADILAHSGGGTI